MKKPEFLADIYPPLIFIIFVFSAHISFIQLVGCLIMHLEGITDSLALVTKTYALTVIGTLLCIVFSASGLFLYMHVPCRRPAHFSGLIAGVLLIHLPCSWIRKSYKK